MIRLRRPELLALWICSVVVAAAPAIDSSQTPSSAYFVSATGSDVDRGTADAPWRTIQRCVNQATAGDTCTIGPGTFTEIVAISRNGSSERPISVIGQDSGSTIVEGSLAISGDYIVVEDMRVNMPSGATWGLRLSGRSGVARNIHVTTESASLGLDNAAAQVSGSHNVLTRSRLEMTCFGLMLGGTSNVISHNEVTDLRPNGGRCGDIDYVRLFGSNHELRNNVLQGIDRSKTGSAHVDCFQTFDNNGPERAVQNVVIDGNLCSDASQGVLFQARTYRQSRNIVISNNVFSRLGAWCALLEDIEGVRIINNTCDTSTALHGMWCRSSVGAGSCEFKNNIFYGRGTAYGVMGSARLIDGDAAAPGKNNLLFVTDGGRVSKGYSADRLNEDPQFVDRASGDYRLTPSSPARDAGMAIDGWPDPLDLDGVTRPQGDGWDIGAFEYNADSRPASPNGLRLISSQKNR